MTTIERFEEIYRGATAAQKQRFDDIITGITIAREKTNGPVYGNHQSDPDIPRDRAVTPTKGDPQ